MTTSIGAATAESIYGWAAFRDHGHELLAKASSTDSVISFSTSQVLPQVRFRPTRLDRKTADDIPEGQRVKYQEVKRELNQYRTLVMIGESFIVTSGPMPFIMDRHPTCSSAVIDIHMKRVRTKAAGRMVALTRADAQKASQGVQTVLDEVRALALAEKKNGARLYGILALLTELKETGKISERHLKFLERMMVKEGAEIALERGVRRRTAADLQRTEAD